MSATKTAPHTELRETMITLLRRVGVQNKKRSDARNRNHEEDFFVAHHLFRKNRKTTFRDDAPSVLGRPGSDLLFQALRLSTIGAEGFDVRVRDGFGSHYFRDVELDNGHRFRYI